MSNVLELFSLRLSFWVLIIDPLIEFEPLIRLYPLGNTDEQASNSNGPMALFLLLLFLFYFFFEICEMFWSCVKRRLGFFCFFFFILFVSLYELVCIELKFQALVLVHFKLVATLLVGLTAHCGHRLVGFIFELNVSMDFD